MPDFQDTSDLSKQNTSGVRVPTPVEPPPSGTNDAQPVDMDLVNSLLQSSDTIPSVNAAHASGSQSSGTGGNTKKKHTNVGLILAGLLILVIIFPIGIYFISQRTPPLTEDRSRAADGPYPAGCLPKAGYENNPMAINTCTGSSEYNCKNINFTYCQWIVPTPGGTTWKGPGVVGNTSGCTNSGIHIEGFCLVNAGTVTKYTCSDPNKPQGCNENGGTTTDACVPSGSFCGTVQIDAGGTSGSCFISRSSNVGCNPVQPTGHTNPTSPPRNTSTPTPTRPPNTTATPTPTTIPGQCTRIRVYKDGQIVNPSTLRVGDAVQISVTGPNATKGRIRVNGGAWNETTTTNAAGEYYVSFTIPSGITSFTIESEVFINNIWK